LDSGKKALIHYLFHSGFTVEVGKYFLVFDYFRPPGGNPEFELTRKVIGEKISGYKYPFVFVSHSHHDHFSPDIFDWKKNNPTLTYILSNDIELKDAAPKKRICPGCLYMEPYEHMEVNGVSISTYSSTDIGVSFLLEAEGLRIFHAGDLNWWHWAEESTRQELEEEERKFKDEVKKIDGESVDIMFFPVDPRLGEHYWLGGGYIMETIKPNLFVPMHFGENYGITEKFAQKMKHARIPVVEIGHIGQSFIYKSK
jgi:L-ascorbate metabolism protein UlaG (beta-lactamase superfamily)